eukprot:828-Heterococcus_DN1.PRE.5
MPCSTAPLKRTQHTTLVHASHARNTVSTDLNKLNFAVCVHLYVFVSTQTTGESYLRADYSVECYTPQHKLYTAYAAVMTAVYPIGIPLLYAVVLRKKRRLARAAAHVPVSYDSSTTCGITTATSKVRVSCVHACCGRLNDSTAYAMGVAASTRKAALIESLCTIDDKQDCHSTRARCHCVRSSYLA